MIFIPRRLFATYILLSICIVLCVGGAAYLVLNPSVPFSPMEKKLTAEWFLYATILSVLLLGIVTAKILSIRSQIKKELGRIRSMSTYVSLSSQLKSRKLYELGPLLSDLFLQVSRINERQSLKMSAQSALLELLVTHTDAPIAVTDLFGGIFYVSEEFTKKMDLEREQLIGNNIERLISNVYIQTVLNSIETQQVYKKEQAEDTAFSVFPIYNREREVAYLLFDLRVHSDFAHGQGQGSALIRGFDQAAGATHPLSQWKTLNRFIGRFFAAKSQKNHD